MSKRNLGINEIIVLLETDALRVVGIGRNGWRFTILIEQAHKDAMGEVSWHLLHQVEFRSDRTSVKDEISDDALLAALDRIHELEIVIEGQRLEIEGK